MALSVTFGNSMNLATIALAAAALFVTGADYTKNVARLGELEQLLAAR